MNSHSTDLTTAGNPLSARPPMIIAASMSTATLRSRVAAAAKCAGNTDDALWFPSLTGHYARSQYAEHARAACLGCAVAGECLELAVREESAPGESPYGVRGGLAPWQRKALVRLRRRARTAVAA